MPLTDLGAALFALTGILAALHYRDRTGLGQHIDTSLVEAGIALSVWEAAEYFGHGIAPEPLGSAHRMVAPYQAIRCADGYITLAGGTDRLFQRLCTVLGHREWTTDPAFANDTLRVRNRATLIERIEAMTTQEPRAHWLARFDEAGVPCGPINDYQQTFADPHVHERGMVVSVEHPTLGPLRTLGSPIKMSATPPVTARRAPLLGEHTREVLREIGYGEAEIEEVMASTGPVA